MMRKNFVIFMLVSICLLSAHAQRSCKDCIQDLYKVVEGSLLDSISIGHSFYSVKSLYQGKGHGLVVAAIAKARVFSYGNPLDSVVMLDLGDKALYFMVNTEPPRSFKHTDINCVYDSEGRNLLNKEDYMMFPAVINDPDGFTFVREGPSTKFKVKAKIEKDKIFFYTPILSGDWYRVYLRDGGQCIGYVHCSRILPYDKCSMQIKKKMRKLMF